MPDTRPRRASSQAMATHTDVTRILGDMDDATVAEILGLHPTIAHLDAAAMWITGDDDIVARKTQPGADVVAKIVDILAIADEEEPVQPPRPIA